MTDRHKIQDAKKKKRVLIRGADKILDTLLLFNPAFSVCSLLYESNMF